MTDIADAIGMAAGCLTTVSFLPQLAKCWRTRSTRDISLLMFSSFSVGVALWTVYGFLVAAWPIIITNMVTLALATIILAMKLRDLITSKKRAG